MSKHKSGGKHKKKGSQLVIRVDKAERDAFVSLCDKIDTSAAREIRRFMRKFVSAHAGGTNGVGDTKDDAFAANAEGDKPVSDPAIAEDSIAELEPSSVDTRKPAKE